MNSLIKGTAIYQYFAEQYQLRIYNNFIKRHLSCSLLNSYSEDTLKTELKRRSLLRRTLSDPIVVAGFGTNDDWRRNGLWDALTRLTDFNLYEVPDHGMAHVSNEYEEMRIKKDGFLRFITFLEETKPVNVAFFAHSGRHISDDLISQLHNMGIWTIIMSVDDKHQFIRPIDRVTSESHQLRVARQADIYWTNWKFGTQLVSSIGGNPLFMPEGANPAYYKPLNLKRDLDVVFIGSNYGYRQTLVNYLTDMGINVAAYGYGWLNGFLTSEETILLYNRAKIVLGVGGVGRTIKVNHLKGRDFEVPMCGAVYLTNYNPELADCFTIGKEIICYGSFEECLEMILSTLHDDHYAQAIRNAARCKSITHHTWVHRISQLMQYLTPFRP